MNILQAQLIEISETGFLTVYQVDTEEATYLDAIKLDVEVLADNEYCNFFEARDLFCSAKAHLMPGTYFSVYKSSLGGSEWWTEVVLAKDEQKKADKVLKRKRVVSKLFSWIRKHGDTIVILISLLLGALWIKSGI